MSLTGLSGAPSLSRSGGSGGGGVRMPTVSDNARLALELYRTNTISFVTCGARRMALGLTATLACPWLSLSTPIFST